MNTGGQVLLTRQLNRILAFDPQTGIIQVEPGVTFRALLDAFLPDLWLAPVTPGTGFATIGGAVANDVHGKNHERAGSFGQHVTQLDLLTPDGVLRTIGPGDDLFRATIGGIGLTGLVTRIAFRMARVPGNSVSVHEQRVADLDDFLAAIEAAAAAAYSVGWIDGTARGASLGRGILETAEPAPETLATHRRPFRIPLDFPGFVLNPWTVSAFNAAYFHRVPKAGRTSLRHLGKFLYPLDALTDWNRIYGKAGFYQFQCVVPFERGRMALRNLLERIAASRRASFLAVLKRMGPGATGMLSFPVAGYTLALDFPRRPGVEELYADLVEITQRFGGRVYLAKDALLKPGAFAAMYPELPAFRTVLDRIDPDRRMASDMSRRLGVRIPA